MNLSTCKAHLKSWCELLEARHVAAGKDWYDRANTFAFELAHLYALPVSVTAAVIAVLSPFLRWESNMEAAETLIKAYREDLPLKSLRFPGFSANLRKAIRILRNHDKFSTEMLGTPRAMKVRAFYECILYPHTSDKIVIDRWMLRVFGLEFYNLTIRTYQELSALLREQAEALGMYPSKLQASLWLLAHELAIPPEGEK